MENNEKLLEAAMTIKENCEKTENGKPCCHNGDPCHIAAPRGAKTGTQGLDGSRERSRIPKLLREHIVEICEEEFI